MKPEQDTPKSQAKSSRIMASRLSPLNVQNVSMPSEKNLLQSPPIVLSPSFEGSRPSSQTSAKATTPSSPTKLSSLSSLVSNVHRTTGRVPPPLVGATTTILGDKLYVFGGKTIADESSVHYSSIYELDLCHRHWTLLQTKGTTPRSRYFHSMCPLGDSKLVCYGGMACDVPETPRRTNEVKQEGAGHGTHDEAKDNSVVVYSDLYIFDITSLTWTQISPPQSPVGRYAHAATIIPSSSTLVSSNATEALPVFANGTTSQQANETTGPETDGTGGAELVIIGGQDSASEFIEEINFFNLRSLRWTRSMQFPRQFGQYRGCAVSLNAVERDRLATLGKEHANSLHIGGGEGESAREPASEQENPNIPTFLMYANYNIPDPQHELHIQLSNDVLLEKPVHNDIRPPFLRFPYGEVIDNHLIIGGIDLTNNHHEYSLWSLDLQTQWWSRIDPGASILSHGSWNTGALWTRRNIFVVLGHRQRDLMRDYRRRRTNYAHICFIELEPLGLYDNPRHREPVSSFASDSAPPLPTCLQGKSNLIGTAGGGRPHFAAARELGMMAMEMTEMADMEILTLDEERVPVNSHMLSKRWGPYFIHLLREASDSLARQHNPPLPRNPRPVSSVRPSLGNTRSMTTTGTPLTTKFHRDSVFSTFSTVAEDQSSHNTVKSSTSPVTIEPFSPDPSSNFEPPSTHVLAPTSRHRVLYLPHTLSTVRLLVHFLYTSTLPPPDHPYCTAQALCSLLQLARPYQVDGLIEATVERLHQVFNDQSAAAIFNGAAMAAGGGRGTGFLNALGIPSSPPPDSARLRGPWESETSSLAGSLEENGSMRPGTSISVASVSTNPSLPADAPQHATITSRPPRRQRGFSRLNIRLRRSESMSSVSTAESGGTDPSATDSNASHSTSNPSIPPGSQRPDLHPHPSPVAPSPIYEHKGGWQSVSSDISTLSTQSQFINEKSNTSHPHQQHLRNSGDTSGGATTASSTRREQEIWTGTMNSVIGLQKRGLRELMEGRRIRSRATSHVSGESLSPVSPLSDGKKNDEESSDIGAKDPHAEGSQSGADPKDLQQNGGDDTKEDVPDGGSNSLAAAITAPNPPAKAKDTQKFKINIASANAQNRSPMASPSITINRPGSTQAEQAEL